MTPPMGAAVVGLGVGRQHALTLARTSGVELRWVYDLDGARMREVLVEVGKGAAATGYQAILDDPATHLVSLATFDHLHADEVCRALAAGKHVFCEKPLCNGRDELARVKAAWQASRRGLRSNLVLRGAPLYQWLRRTIASGELGEIYAFDGDYLYGRLSKITEGWRGEVQGYSVMRGGGVHLVDLMLWLTGQRPTAVTSVGNRIVTRETKFQSKDFVASTFEFPSGCIGRITANFGCVHRHQHVVRVFGTRATFLYDDQGPRLYRERDPGGPALRPDHSAEPPSKGTLIPAFVEAIASGADHEAAARREFDLIEACLAADDALEKGQRVSF